MPLQQTPWAVLAGSALAWQDFKQVWAVRPLQLLVVWGWHRALLQVSVQALSTAYLELRWAERWGKLRQCRLQP
jgi:hypothetical protein